MSNTSRVIDDGSAVEERAEAEDGLGVDAPGTPTPVRRPQRRLSGFESIDETVDPDLERARYTAARMRAT